VAIPDPGEYARALTGENEITLTIPSTRIPEVIEGLKIQQAMGMTNDTFNMEMEADFARPSFYNRVFKSWGLDEGRLWDKELS